MEGGMEKRVVAEDSLRGKEHEKSLYSKDKKIKEKKKDMNAWQ